MVIKANNVKKSYGKLEVLKDISLQVKEGQVVCIIGPSGSGKSTFLKYICKNTKKKNIVLAPTGISAVNVGGQTLHSFFKIPFKPLLPDDPEFSPRKIRQTLRYSKDKVNWNLLLLTRFRW